MAKKIYETAESYGIGREDLLIDALCMTVSSVLKKVLWPFLLTKKVQ